MSAANKAIDAAKRGGGWVKGEHRCPLPEHWQRTAQWECGRCGRVWTPGQFGWTEVRGPR